MTLYINPSSMTKEEFLDHFGTELQAIELNEMVNWDLRNKTDICLISLVQNPSFSAAGIIEDKRDFVRWSQLRDGRPKRWFIVQTKDINEFGGVAVKLER